MSSIKGPNGDPVEHITVALQLPAGEREQRTS